MLVPYASLMLPGQSHVLCPPSHPRQARAFGPRPPLSFPGVQGLLEARQELRASLRRGQERLKDVVFLDLALDSTARTAVERGMEYATSAQVLQDSPCNALAVLWGTGPQCLGFVSVKKRAGALRSGGFTLGFCAERKDMMQDAPLGRSQRIWTVPLVPGALCC